MVEIGPGGGCIVAWIVIGWFCGTGPRIVVLGPIGPQPDTDPPDTMGWLVRIAVGIVGGVVGGYLFHEMFSVDHADAAGILLTFAGALAAGRIAVELAGRAMPRLTAR